jgi:hypothetical protein
MLRAAVLREIFLKLSDVRAETKRAVIQGLGDHRIDFFAEWPHLRREVEIGN